MKTLDADQKRIVESDAAKMVVVAGAGSGKTAVLTERIRYLVNVKGVNPANITAITFTNMAADELKERLADIDGVDDMFIGTIHSFANHILRDSGKRFKLLTDEVNSKLVKELVDKYCKHLTVDKYIKYENVKKAFETGSPNIKRRDVQNVFDASEQIEFDAITRKDTDDGNTKYPESVYSLCKKRNIMTFDDLLVEAKQYIDRVGSMEYVFVDEYQDVGNLEDEFIRALSADNYFFVGDDWQSIYGFKGANVSIFKDYVKAAGWTVYHLDNNYRNAANIVEFANKVIKSVVNRIEKHIRIMNEDRGNVTTDKQENLEAYLNKIKKNKRKDNWFILTRNKDALNFILGKCEEMDIPAMALSKTDSSLEEIQEMMRENKVKVMTIHASKGLEADNVILYGNFPVYVDIDEYSEDAEKLYEERRVFYVGATRAKSRLIVLSQ